MNIFKKFYYYLLCNRPYSEKSFSFLLHLYHSGEKDAGFALKCLGQNIRYYGFTEKTVQIFIDSGLDILDNDELSGYKLPEILIKSLMEQKKYDKLEELMNKHTLADSCYTQCLLPMITQGNEKARDFLIKAFYLPTQAYNVCSCFVLEKILKQHPECVKELIISSTMTDNEWNMYFIDFIHKMWNNSQSNLREWLRLYLAYHCVCNISLYPFIRRQAMLQNQLYISSLRFNHEDKIKPREVELCSKIEKMLAQGKTQKEIFCNYEAILVNIVYTLSFFAKITYLLPDYAELFRGIAHKLYGKEQKKTIVFVDNEF